MPTSRLETYFAGSKVGPTRVPINPPLYQVIVEGHYDHGIFAEHGDLSTILRVLSLADTLHAEGRLPYPPAVKAVREGDRLKDGSRARTSRPIVPLQELIERVTNLRDAGLPDDFLVPSLDDFVTPGGITDESHPDQQPQTEP